MKSLAKALLLSVAFAGISQLAYNFYKKKNKYPKKEIHEAIMFSDDVDPRQRSKFSKSMVTPSLGRVLYYLDSPRHSLDVCMYVLTNMELTNALMKLNYRGVHIRIIIDADMAFSTGSTVHKLEKQGIPVRWRKSTNLMHHKFCLIDSSTDDPRATPLLMTGSLNWTRSALSGNWEDVVVTSQEQLVRQYKEEFERLWVMFKPVIDLS